VSGDFRRRTGATGCFQWAASFGTVLGGVLSIRNT